MGTNCFNIICLVSKKRSLGSLNSDLFYLDNVHLVENGNLKVAESIFSFINNFDKIKHNIHIQFNKSCKMAVSFKLNNADFPPLSFPNLSVSCSSVPFHYLMLLLVILCLIMLVYHLSIVLGLLINISLWFPIFYVARLFLTKCTFHMQSFAPDLAFSVST